MDISPRDGRRVILLVSPSQLDASWRNADPEKIITFTSLSEIVAQKNPQAAYRCWLIFAKPAEKTMHFLRQRFSTAIDFGDLPPIKSMDNADEIFSVVQQIAHDPHNVGETIVCDCTGGSKTMAIAMALACNHFTLTSESQTRLVLTYILRDRIPFSFPEFDLSRVIAEEQRRYVDQQERIGRLHYIARLSRILAHEIYNPLNLINTALYLLRTESLSHNAKEQCGKIEKAFKEIDKVIHNVQQAVRKEADMVSPQAIRLTEVIRRLHGRTEKLFPDLVLSIKGEVSGIRLKITEEKLYSVFTNLIDNAAHATEGKGTVSLHFEKYEDHLHILVEDNGPGIPDELQKNLFKPLYRGKNSSGTGMGLSIVRTFLVEEGGSIAFDDKYEQGARFIIDLPRDKNGEAQS